MHAAFRDLGQIDDLDDLKIHMGSQSKEGWELRRGHQRLRVEELDIETYIDCLEAWHAGRKELQRLEEQMEREGPVSYFKD